MIEAPLDIVRELHGRLAARQYVQEQPFAQQIPGRPTQPGFAARSLPVEHAELQLGRACAGFAIQVQLVGGREQHDIERPGVAGENAHAEQVLLDFCRLQRRGLRDVFGAVAVQPPQPRKSYLSVVDETLPQPALLQAHQQIALGRHADAPADQGRDQRKRIDARQTRLA